MPTVNNITDLNNAIAADNAATGSGTLTITLGKNISLDNTAITPINIQTGLKLVIDGGGFWLDGGGTQRVLRKKIPQATREARLYKISHN